MARPRKAVNEVTVIDEVTTPTTTGEQAVDTAQPPITPEPAVEQVPSGEPVQANNAQETAQETAQDAQQQPVLAAPATQSHAPVVIQSPEEALAKFKARAKVLAAQEAAQQQALGFTVVNNEFFDMVEPATMTTIKKQGRQHIQCHSTEQKVRAINNIKQLIALGRKLEIAP